MQHKEAQADLLNFTAVATEIEQFLNQRLANDISDH
jgi:hypothetical protein